MLPTALRLALRRLARRPGTTAVHVGGLAVGLGCCFLALLFVRDELSYDRFHDGAERIVEVRQHVRLGEQMATFSEMPREGRAALRDGVTGIEALTETISQAALVRNAPLAEGVVVDAVRFADADFLSVFTFPLVQGNPRTALAEPNTAVVTEALAQSLFGQDPAVGREVFLERTGFGLQDPEPVALTVTGVAADPPTSTNVGFDLLVSGQTPLAIVEGNAPALSGTGATYLRLGSLRDTVSVKAALNRLALADDAEFASFGEPLGVFTPRLVDRHFADNAPRSSPTGRPVYLVLFLAVAGLVLLLACVNYANLATALALGRATEVGVRKTLGAGRSDLVRLFLAEALSLSLVASLVAVGLVAAALPAFNTFFEKGVSLSGLGVSEWAVVPALALVAGLLAGAYPALVLARFQPIAALRGRVATGRAGVRVRQALVVFQFAVTGVLLAATAVVAQQMDSARSGDLGFEGDRVVVLGLQADRLRQASEALRERAKAIPGVTRASLTTGIPGDMGMSTSISPATTTADPSDDVTMASLRADPEFPTTLGLRLAAGEWFEPNAEAASRVVLNEAAARQLGLMTTDPSEALGRSVGFGYSGETSEVVGVLRDFRFEGPRSEIRPVLVSRLDDPRNVNTLFLSIQLASADARTMAAVRRVWEKTVPEYPFDPRFVSDTFADQLREDQQLGQLFGAVGLIAIVLACLGVFGMAAHEAQRRTKEIGVRKVLGATVAGLVARLSGEFVRLVVVALVVAAPLAWWLAQRWLEGFAYPAPLSAGPFVLVGVGVLALALLAAGVHAVRAATADPVRALRSE